MWCAKMRVETFLLVLVLHQVNQLRHYQFAGKVMWVIAFCDMSLIFGLSEGKTGKLLISASATVGGLLLVALMCFWGCFLYKKLGTVESKSLAIAVGGGDHADSFCGYHL